jgi:outer membrane protein assembly factor BamE (lipoprotein component of BamABCDE complex)
MKKIILILTAIILSACANAQWRSALDQTNQVKNGMTSKEVIAIMGMPPLRRSTTEMLWGYGSYQTWNGTRQGAARFLLKDDVTYGIPEGGIFSSGGIALYVAESVRRQDTLAKEAEEQKKIKEAQLAKEKAIMLEEMAAETEAISKSALRCLDKSICTKMFSLAQIYVSSRSDQKIQVATDTIIETYNPTTLHNIGMKIVKTPKQGSAEEVAITVTCKELELTDSRTTVSEYLSSKSFCRKKRTEMYAGFRPFMESSLAK